MSHRNPHNFDEAHEGDYRANSLDALTKIAVNQEQAVARESRTSQRNAPTRRDGRLEPHHRRERAAEIVDERTKKRHDPEHHTASKYEFHVAETTFPTR
jgi:hypothetical protein